MGTFSPIDISDAKIHRRLMFRTIPFFGAWTRFVWRHSSASRSSWYERTTLWQALWNFNRNLGCLPRVRSHIVNAKMSRQVRMSLDLCRLNDAFVFCFGIGESDVSYVCSLFSHPDSVIIDVGANIGSTTLAFSEMVPTGQVLAFEPSLEMRCVLESNIKYSQAKNIAVYPFGLSDMDMRGQLHIAMPGNPGSAYFAACDGDTNEKTVELQTLDKVIGEDRVVDLIKVDVEGFEHRVLKGGKRLVTRCKPVLVVEVNNGALSRAGTSSKELIDLMKNWGYKLFYLVKGQFKSYIPEIHLCQGIHNVVAVHPDSARHWQVLRAYQATK